MNDGFGPGIVIGGIIVFLIGLFFFSCYKEGFEKDAIKHDKAEYYLDTNFVKQWRWK